VCDACPAVAGQVPDGCPQRVLIEECHFPTDGTVHFEADAATPTPPSAEIIEALARLIAAHPELRRVGVDGHASAGERDARRLSARRADAVLASLVARGVSASRLVARAYGVEAPVVPAAVPGAGARNRRVSLQILEADPPPQPPPPAPRRALPAGCPGSPAVPGAAAFPPLEGARSAVVIAAPFDAPDRWRWWRGRGDPDLYRNGGRVRGPSALGTAFLFLDRGLLVGTPDAAARGGGVIVAAEVDHPAPRWQLALAPAEYMSAAAALGDDLILATATRGAAPHTVLSRVGRGAGDVRWTRPVAAGSPIVEIITEASTAVVISGDALAAIDLADGQTRWQRDVPSSGAALAQGRLVLRVPGEGLRVLDAATGSELRRLPLATAGSQGSIELVGSTVYVVEPIAPHGTRLRAIDVATGARVWDSEGGLAPTSPVSGATTAPAGASHSPRAPPPGLPSGTPVRRRGCLAPPTHASARNAAAPRDRS